MTSQDFTTRLQLQLREAALREERRGTLARRAAHARSALLPRVALGPLVAAAAVGAAILVAVWMVTSLRRPEPATPAGPRVVATVDLAQTMNGAGVAAFGALWVADSGRGQILRVDPRSRRVTARIPVGGDEAGLGAGAGSVWAIPHSTGSSGPLLRIDPRTGRIVARIPLRSTQGPVVALFVLVGPRVWVLGPGGALAVDQARNRVVREITVAGGYRLNGAVMHGRELWLSSTDGNTTRYDGRTGARLGRVGWKPGPVLLPFRNALIEVGKNSVSLVAANTGRAVWRSVVGQEIKLVDTRDGRVFVEGREGVSPRERLWELDARTGHVTGPLVVPEIGGLGLVATGADVWVLTGGGRAVVVRR